MNTATIADAIRRAAPEVLDTLSRAATAAWANGELQDHELQETLELIQARRRTGQGTPSANQRRQGPRPEREVLVLRRRAVACCGMMPPRLANRFTEGERAVLMILADRIRVAGFCDMFLAEIAAKAGVSRSTAKAAIRHAQDLELLAVQLRPVKGRGRKSRTNIITMVSAEWKAWISFRKGRVTESWSDNSLSPMNTRKIDSLFGGRLAYPLAPRPGPGAPWQGRALQ